MVSSGSRFSRFRSRGGGQGAVRGGLMGLQAAAKKKARTARTTAMVLAMLAVGAVLLLATGLGGRAAAKRRHGAGTAAGGEEDASGEAAGSYGVGENIREGGRRGGGSMVTPTVSPGGDAVRATTENRRADAREGFLVSGSPRPKSRDDELERQEWDEHIPDEFLPDPPAIDMIFKRNYGIPRPRPGGEKAHNVCMLKTHKTASTTLGSIFFRCVHVGTWAAASHRRAACARARILTPARLPMLVRGSRFAARNGLRVYNREGHQLNAWRFWFEGVNDDPAESLGYNMVITHYGKATGTRRETWYTNDQPDEASGEDDEASGEDDGGSGEADGASGEDDRPGEGGPDPPSPVRAEGGALPSEGADGVDERAESRRRRRLASAAAPGVERIERVAAEDAGETVEGEAPTIGETVEREEDDEEAERPPGRPRSTGDDGAAAGTGGPADAAPADGPGAEAPAEVEYRDITLRNFTDWCASVVGGPSHPDGPKTHAVVTTIREPVGRFLSWYFFYIEPELTYNFGDERFGAAGEPGTGAGARGADEEGDRGGLYASRAAVADRLYMWMRWHGTPTDPGAAGSTGNGTDAAAPPADGAEDGPVSLDNTFNHQARELLLWSDEHVREFLQVHAHWITDDAGQPPARSDESVVDLVMLADRSVPAPLRGNEGFPAPIRAPRPDRPPRNPNQVRRVPDRPQAHAQLGHERPHVPAHVELRRQRREAPAALGRPADQEHPQAGAPERDDALVHRGEHRVRRDAVRVLRPRPGRAARGPPCGGSRRGRRGGGAAGDGGGAGGHLRRQGQHRGGGDGRRAREDGGGAGHLRVLHDGRPHVRGHHRQLRRAEGRPRVSRAGRRGPLMCPPQYLHLCSPRAVHARAPSIIIISRTSGPSG